MPEVAGGDGGNCTSMDEWGSVTPAAGGGGGVDGTAMEEWEAVAWRPMPAAARGGGAAAPP